MSDAAPPAWTTLHVGNAYRFKAATIEARRWSPDPGPDGDEWGEVETHHTAGLSRDGWGMWLRTVGFEGLLCDGLWDVRIVSEPIHRDALAFVC